LERIYTSDDPTGIFLLAFAIAVPMWLAALWLRWIARIALGLFRAALQGRRERLERERARRARPGPNWLAADLRRRRAGTQP
jgi:hypothetical protein